MAMTPSAAAVSAAAAALEVFTPEPEEDRGPITELPLEGWPGRGLPLQVGSGLKRRGISDGGGADAFLDRIVVGAPGTRDHLWRKMQLRETSRRHNEHGGTDVIVVGRGILHSTFRNFTWFYGHALAHRV